MDFIISKLFRPSNRCFCYGDHGPTGVTGDRLALDQVFSKRNDEGNETYHYWWIAMDFGVSKSFRLSNRHFHYGDHGPARVTADGLAWGQVFPKQNGKGSKLTTNWWIVIHFGVWDSFMPSNRRFCYWEITARRSHLQQISTRRSISETNWRGRRKTHYYVVNCDRFQCLGVI